MPTLLNARLTLLPEAPRPPEDALWLAASLPLLPPQTPVLDAGCGIGTAGLALLIRQPHLTVTGVDIDPQLTHFANAHAALNGLTYSAYTHSVLSHIPAPQGLYPAIMCNPPFYPAPCHTPPATETARRTKHLPHKELSQWLTALSTVLSPNGTLFLILHTACLPELLQWAQNSTSHLQTTLLRTSPKRAPKRFLATLTPAPTYTHISHNVLNAYTPSLREHVLSNAKGLQDIS